MTACGAVSARRIIGGQGGSARTTAALMPQSPDGSPHGSKLETHRALTGLAHPTRGAVELGRRAAAVAWVDAHASAAVAADAISAARALQAERARRARPAAVDVRFGAVLQAVGAQGLLVAQAGASVAVFQVGVVTLFFQLEFAISADGHDAHASATLAAAGAWHRTRAAGHRQPLVIVHIMRSKP